MLAAVGGIVALAAVPSVGFPQPPAERFRPPEYRERVLPQSPADRLRADDDRERIAAEISAAVANSGPQSSDLIEPLTALGNLYATEGQHALAAAALEEARHLVRANYGLYTLEQAPLMQQALENQQALGNFAMVQAFEEELYDLANRHPADFRTVAIHRAMGARRMNILKRLLADEYPAEIYGESGLFSLSRGAVAADLVSEAQIHYADAAAVVLRNGLYSSDELRDLETEIVRASDLFRQLDDRIRYSPSGGFRRYGVGARERGPGWYVTASEELQTRTNALWDLTGSESSQEAKQRRQRVGDAPNPYRLGRESYHRLVAYDEARSGSTPADEQAWRSRLTAYLQVVDWDLLYSENGAALKQYARVHALLKTNAIAEPLMAELFEPPIPIVLPTFLQNPLETPASARYIDVAFEVTRYGTGRRIEIIGAAPNVSDAAKNDLVNLIKSSRFRPRVTDGELERASPVVVRYYLND
jgi:hypothetical protein